jgi:dihydrofolate synthase/folylpolyglutamate synthase
VTQPGPISTVDQGYSYFEAFMNLERGGYSPRAYRLDRMERLLTDFDNPQCAYRTIHVAGSKGKGSVSAFTASILAASGLRCGCYASPHVSSYTERVRVLTNVDGAPCDDLPDSLLVEQFERIRLYIGRISATTPDAELPTTFELLTLFAFLVFQESRCQIAVIEVGLGGRLDATNLVRPEIGVITPIEREHTDYLGETIEEIAREKAGIVKPGMHLFVSSQYPDALVEILRIASQRSVPVDMLHTDTDIISTEVDFSGTRLVFRDGTGQPRSAHLKLLGKFQAENAVMAVRVTEKAVPGIDTNTIVRGLESTWLPGRLEVVRGKPIIVVDGAHTLRSTQALVETITELGIDRTARTLIFGAVAGKDHRTMVETLATEFGRIVVARPGTFKKSNLAALLKLCREYHPDCVRRDEMADALAEARRGGPAIIVVTGSLYLAGEARDCLLREGTAVGLAGGYP